MIKPESGSNDHESSYAHVSAETLEQDQNNHHHQKQQKRRIREFS
jgi:hypothetical protein